MFGAVLQLWQKRNDAPDINDTFDRLSFLESGMLPYQSSPERFRVMNPMLIYCLEQRVTMMEPEMFLRFVETCRAEDISQHLPIFSSFLPINNAKGAGQLSAWIGSQATDRFIAMYIFALHPPEYFAPYEATSGIFKKEPHLFVEEMQQILTAFNKNPLLDHHSNLGIKTELEAFYHDKRWVDRLENACNPVELKRNYGAVISLV